LELCISEHSASALDGFDDLGTLIACQSESRGGRVDLHCPVDKLRKSRAEQWRETTDLRSAC
jgi:hypothetical protein